MGLSIGSGVLIFAQLIVVITGNNEALAIWADGSRTSPGFSLWDGNEFSTPQEMRDIDGSWKVIRGDYSPIRDEAIVIGVTDDQVVTAQSYSGGAWIDRATTSHWWGFDVRYESQSGNPLLVWHEGPTDTIRYAKWTGSTWSLGTIPTPVRGGEHDELNLEASPKSNEMVLVVGAGSDGDYVIVWDGESWGGGLVLKNADHADATSVNVAFEQQRGRAIIMYADGSTSLKYRIWDSATWSEEESVSPPAGIQNRISRVAVGADPTTNRIVAAVTTYSDNAFWVTVWDGNATWGSKAVVASGSPASSSHGLAVAFEGTSQHALAAYTQAGNGVKYRTWSSSSGWSDEEGCPDLGAGPNTMRLYTDNGSNDVMLAVQSDDRDTSFCKWSGAGWGEVVQMTNIAGDSQNKTHPFVFMWKPVAATEAPTPSPTSHPTPPPTYFPTRAPSTMPTPQPVAATEAPTFFPTSRPTPPSTTFPTRLPSMMPTPLPVAAGHPCSSNQECMSRVCRNGVCMATSACYPVKHKFGEQFFEHKINIVFVASGFDTATKEEWQAQVNNTYNFFENYNMLSSKVEQLNIFRVDPSEMDSSFCALGCLGVGRLLCCDQSRAHSLGQNCFPVGSNLQTVVIHNNEGYGGAGYSETNIAAITKHPDSPAVAAHEFGHSLFELADEYSFGSGTDEKANCDSTSSCDKWSDLIGNTPAGYEPVQCLPGCRNGDYYIGGESFLNTLGSPMGAVNERFACCTFQALTKSCPSFCDAFNPSPNYLLNYCKNNDYQGYGSESYDKNPVQAILAGSAPDSSTKYVQVEHPMLVTITSTTTSSGAIAYKSELSPLEPGLFLRSRVEGDFKSPSMALEQGFDSVLKVVTVYRTGKEIIYISRNTTLDVPIPQDVDDDDEPRVVSVLATSLTAVLDTKDTEVMAVKVKIVDLS